VWAEWLVRAEGVRQHVFNFLLCSKRMLNTTSRAVLNNYDMRMWVQFSP
jgi:hypothetical protein